jgi:peptide/nickel transport system permease protein
MTTQEQDVVLPHEGLFDAVAGQSNTLGVPTEEVPGIAPLAVTRRSRLGLILATAWLVGIIVLAIVANWLPISGPNVIPDSAHSLRGPGLGFYNLLGTDSLGRSQLSRIIYGARSSLEIGALATLFGLVIGTTIGLLAGYHQRWVDWSTGLITNSLLAFPPLLFLLTVVAVFAASSRTLVGALAILAIPLFARVARANTLAFVNRDFVTAARGLGASPFRIIFREILPNVMLPMISYISIVAATLIVAEGSLSYLGLGIPPPTPSWGSMMSDGFTYMAQDPWVVFIPAMAFFFTVYSLNLSGDWARVRFGRGGGR